MGWLVSLGWHKQSASCKASSPALLIQKFVHLLGFFRQQIEKAATFFPDSPLLSLQPSLGRKWYQFINDDCLQLLCVHLWCGFTFNRIVKLLRTKTRKCWYVQSDYVKVVFVGLSVGWIKWTVFSCIDTVVAILTNYCDNEEWGKWKFTESK